MMWGKQEPVPSIKLVPGCFAASMGLYTVVRVPGLALSLLTRAVFFVDGQQAPDPCPHLWATSFVAQWPGVTWAALLHLWDLPVAAMWAPGSHACLPKARRGFLSLPLGPCGRPVLSRAKQQPGSPHSMPAASAQ